MGGMTMWIVLGSLIGVVVIFLIVTSVLDRKKNAKVKVQKEQLSKDVEEAGVVIAKEVSEVIKENEKLLKDFVPSVGKLKMSDINKKAKDGLKIIHKSRNYKLLKHMDKRAEEFDSHFLPLLNTKSNNWPKRNKTDITFFTSYKPPVKKVVEAPKKKKRKGKK